MSLNETQTAPPVEPINDQVADALAVSLRGCEELLPKAEWITKLNRSATTVVPLRINHEQIFTHFHQLKWRLGKN